MRTTRALLGSALFPVLASGFAAVPVPWRLTGAGGAGTGGRRCGRW